MVTARSSATRPRSRCSTRSIPGVAISPRCSAPSDLLELDGQDLRRLPLEVLKTELLRRPHPGVTPQRARRNSRPANSAAKASCRSGLGSSYRSGRSKVCVKVKNLAAPAVRHETGEDWRRVRLVRRRLAGDKKLSVTPSSGAHLRLMGSSIPIVANLQQVSVCSQFRKNMI